MFIRLSCMSFVVNLGCSVSGPSDTAPALEKITLSGHDLYLRVGSEFEVDPSFYVCPGNTKAFYFSAGDRKCNEVTHAGGSEFTLSSEGDMNYEGTERDHNNFSIPHAWELNGRKVYCKRYDGDFLDRSGMEIYETISAGTPVSFLLTKNISSPRDLADVNFFAAAFQTKQECDANFGN